MDSNTGTHQRVVRIIAMYMLPIRALAPDIDLVVWNWTAWVWTAKEILTRSSAMEKMCLET